MHSDNTRRGQRGRTKAASDDWQVQQVDEMLTPVTFDEPVDLVAIITGTLNSLHVYDLAAEFRRRGKQVILGGPHECFFPAEGAQHADAIGIAGGGDLVPVAYSNMLTPDRGRRTTNG